MTSLYATVETKMQIDLQKLLKWSETENAMIQTSANHKNKNMLELEGNGFTTQFICYPGEEANDI